MNLQSVINKAKKAYSTGFFHIFGTNILNKAISFISTSLLVLLLTKTEYGIFTYSWNIYSIVILFNGLGMTSAVLQLCSEKVGEETYTKRISSYGIRIGTKFDLLLVAVLIGVALFAPLKITGSSQLLLLLGLLPIVQFFYDVSLIVLRSQKRNQQFARLSLINTILIFVTSISGVLLFREKGMVIGYYVAYFLSTIYANKKLGISFTHKGDDIQRAEKKSILSIAIVSMANNAISQLLYLLDVFVLGIVAADEAILAGYRVATIIPTALVFIPSSFVTYIYPYFAKNKNNKEWCLNKYKQVVLGIGLLNVAISLFLFVFAKIIILLCFGEQYLDIVPIFRVLAVNYFFSGTFRIIAGNLLVTQRKLKFNLFVAIFCGLINVVADYFFIQWWGAIGAAYATVLVVACSSVLNVSYLLYTFSHIKEVENEKK